MIARLFAVLLLVGLPLDAQEVDADAIQSYIISMTTNVDDEGWG